jgi:methionyl-tRNA synthetase
MDQKKCPHCGKWSSWKLNLTDLCDHCGRVLGGKDLENQEKRLADTKANEDNWMFNIKDTDSDFTKVIKKVGNFFYTIFMAIISFILWLIAALPG